LFLRLFQRYLPEKYAHIQPEYLIDVYQKKKDELPEFSL
jgi:hypothetical protein